MVFNFSLPHQNELPFSSEGFETFLPLPALAGPSWTSGGATVEMN